MEQWKDEFDEYWINSRDIHANSDGCWRLYNDKYSCIDTTNVLKRCIELK
jgi:hypothetical protein